MFAPAIPEHIRCVILGNSPSVTTARARCLIGTLWVLLCFRRSKSTNTPVPPLRRGECHPLHVPRSRSRSNRDPINEDVCLFKAKLCFYVHM
jgi:hypothetical protein